MISVVPDIVVFASFVSIVNILEVDNSKSIQYRCSYENDRRNDIDLWRVFYMLYIVDINQYIDKWRVVQLPDASNTTNHSAYQIDVPGPVKNKLLQDLDHS